MVKKSWLYQFILEEAERYRRAILSYERELKRIKKIEDKVIYEARIDQVNQELEEMYDVLEYLKLRKK